MVVMHGVGTKKESALINQNTVARSTVHRKGYSVAVNVTVVTIRDVQTDQLHHQTLPLQVLPGTTDQMDTPRNHDH